MTKIAKTILFSSIAALALVFAVPGTSQTADAKPWRGGHYYGHYDHHYGRHHRPRYRGYYHGYYRSPYRGFGSYRYPHHYYDRYRYHPHGGFYFGPFRFDVWH
jgi:hypothetical protein